MEVLELVIGLSMTALIIMAKALAANMMQNHMNQANANVAAPLMSVSIPGPRLWLGPSLKPLPNPETPTFGFRLLPSLFGFGTTVSACGRYSHDRGVARVPRRLKNQPAHDPVAAEGPQQRRWDGGGAGSWRNGSGEQHSLGWGLTWSLEVCVYDSLGLSGHLESAFLMSMRWVI